MGDHNGLLKLILNHYRNTKQIRSLEELRNESELFPGVKFRRWFCMPAGVALQFCVGSVYAFSVLNKPVDEHVDGMISNRTPITFTIAIALLGFSAALMGPWLERNGPRKAALLGTSLFFLGNLLASLALYLKWMWLIWIGYGLVGGAGIGLCYIAPVSALQKWFPDRRGLASGVAVAGFGSGSIAMAKVQVWLLALVGLPSTFLILGCIYFIVMALASFVLRSPPPNYQPKAMREIEQTKQNSISVADEQTLITDLKSVDFRLMYLAFLANIMFGLVLISRFSNIVTDIFGRGKDEAASVVAINGGFNLAGRLIFSLFSDFLAILAIFSTLTDTKAYYPFLAAMWILTSCYGAGFSVIPAFLSDKFGTYNVGACHGVILTAWSTAGIVGGIIFTLLFNDLNDPENPSNPFAYNVNSWWLLAVVVVGWGAALMVTPTERDQLVWRFFMCRHETPQLEGSNKLKLEEVQPVQ
ncbi:putative MFS-type transporter YhjX [Folsomia candida]|uniref:Putative MFS-type transporter YhjX n=1 Tax=Folsomia candida TaxID=158441 RepID=A0A226EQD9_FOLCA|nr:putative MFS-type transporter YhjX [Folsomia candida]